MKRGPFLYVAAHEAGHAVARLALDDERPFPAAMIKRVVLEVNRAAGAVYMDREVVFLIEAGSPRTPAILAECERGIVEILAGPYAEFRCCAGREGALLLAARQVARILAIDAAAEREKPLRRARAGENGGDQYVWTDGWKAKSLLDFLAPPDPEAELMRLSQRAATLVETEWPGIIAMARRLRSAIRMDGEQFEDEWRAVRPRAAVRERRARVLRW